MSTIPLYSFKSVSVFDQDEAILKVLNNIGQLDIHPFCGQSIPEYVKALEDRFDFGFAYPVIQQQMMMAVYHFGTDDPGYAMAVTDFQNVKDLIEFIESEAKGTLFANEQICNAMIDLIHSYADALDIKIVQ